MQKPTSNATPNYKTIKLKNLEIFKKPPKLYCQGLLVETSTTLLESAGQFNESRLVRVDLESGKIIDSASIPKDDFAEGIALIGDKVLMLSWQSKKIYQFTYPDLELVAGNLSIDPAMQEGWGLCEYTDTELLATDGSNKIFVLDVYTMKVKKEIPIFLGNKPLFYMNDLTYAEGIVFANVYYSNSIYAIDLEKKQVIGILDMSEIFRNEIKGGLTENRWKEGEVLNGIAYDTFKKVFFVTGKYWGNYYKFEIDFK